MRALQNRLGKPQVAPLQDYHEELRLQMEEKKRKKQQEKEEELAWERKQEERVRQVRRGLHGGGQSGLGGRGGCRYEGRECACAWVAGSRVCYW